MALREIKPFDEKQWKQVSKIIKDGPSEESIIALDEALKMSNREA